MLRKFVGEKIELLPKVPQKNEVVCDECGGIGWLLDEDNKHITKCKCNDGVVRVCEYCKKPYRYAKCDCEQVKEDERLWEEEKDRQHEIYLFEKAKRIWLDDAAPEMIEMLYSDIYPYNEGYFTDLDEFEEYCNENEIEIPKYVWATEKVKLGIDMDSVIENACEDLHEDAYSNIDGIDEIQELVDEWCKKQRGVDTYYQDCRYAILI